VTLSAILLAAGESSRMGQQKALLPWQGTTLILYQLQQLSAVESVGEIIVVTGHQPEAVEACVGNVPRARAIRNPAYRTGKVSSIEAGLNAVSADSDGVLLLGVDQPRPADLLRTIVQEHSVAGMLITVPAYQGRKGHPPIFDHRLLGELLGIDEATEGVRAVMQRHPDDVHVVSTDDPIAVLDLNSPADVRAWEDRGGRSPAGD
jgi:molybdenum cofactor cytidylyltransferase